MEEVKETTIMQKNVHLTKEETETYDSSNISEADVINMAMVMREEKLDDQIKAHEKIEKELKANLLEIRKKFSVSLKNEQEKVFKESKSKLEKILSTHLKDQNYVVSKEYSFETIDTSKPPVKSTITLSFSKNTRQCSELDYTVEYKLPSEIFEFKKQIDKLVKEIDQNSNACIELITEKSNLGSMEKKMKARLTLNKMSKDKKAKATLDYITKMADSENMKKLLGVSDKK